MTTTLPALSELSSFIGSESFYRRCLGRLLYTDGVQYLAENAGAYWLIDVVASYQHKRRVAREPFQLWRLTVDDNHRAIVTMRADSDQKPIVTQRIEYSDFPLPEIELYACDTGQGVPLMLKSEY